MEGRSLRVLLPVAGTAVAFGLLLLLLPGRGRPGLPSGSGPPVLTLLEYLAMGEARQKRFLAEGAGEEGIRLAAALERARASLVRIRVRYARSGGSFKIDHGTGFILEDRIHVATAGHVLDAFAREKDAEATLVTSGGSILHARPAAAEGARKAGTGADFGLLELAEGSIAPAGAGLAAGPREAGRLVAVLGYPGRCGLDPAGAVAGDDIDGNGPLAPLAFIGRTRAGTGFGLDPVAGCVPEGGMSGGPILDSGGKVIGVLASVTRTEKGSASTFVVDGAPLVGIPLPGEGR